MKSLRCLAVLTALYASACLAAAAATRSQEMLTASLRFAESDWDEPSALLWLPAEEKGKVHHVRETSWYALGLLMRDGPGDVARAARIIDAIIKQQFDAPGQEWNGTYRRAPEEAAPPLTGAKAFEHYDPNWRQFIGTTFALILLDHEAKLPAGLPERMIESMRRALEGELASKRLSPSYTNIALMHGFLWSYTGERLHRPEWIAAGETWCSQVHALFAPHGTFGEYNSPTYYGVDLFGLALWRRHGVTEKIRGWGAEMEAGLWRDIGQFYHAGLKNLCGPFDRSYGMDMQRYVSLTGAWMGLELPTELTPLPNPSGPMDHALDFVCIPTYVAVGTKVPDDVLKSFHTFQGERLLRRPIEGSRVATAWLANDVMIGGEMTGATRESGPLSRYKQFHPATIHWRASVHEIGWIRLFASPACDAEAGKGSLTITAPKAGDFVFRVNAPGLALERCTRDTWSLLGLTLKIESDASEFAVRLHDGQLELSYNGAKRLQVMVGR